MSSPQFDDRAPSFPLPNLRPISSPALSAQGSFTTTFGAETPVFQLSADAQVGSLALPSDSTSSSLLDVPGIEAAYTSILSCLDPDVTSSLINSATKCIEELEYNCFKLTCPETLRAFIMLLLCPTNSKPAATAGNVARLCHAILKLPQESRDLLFHWIGDSVPGVLFGARFVKMLQMHLSYHLDKIMKENKVQVVFTTATIEMNEAFVSNPSLGIPPSANPHPSTSSGLVTKKVLKHSITHLTGFEYILRVLRLCFNTNHRLIEETQRGITQHPLKRTPYAQRVLSGSSANDLFQTTNVPLGALVDPEDFYNTDVSSIPDPIFAMDYNRWRSVGFRRLITSPPILCGYPFVIDIAAKRILLSVEAQEQMNLQVQQAMVQSIITGVSSPNFILHVRRNNVVSDTLNQISAVAKAAPQVFKKKLRVVFEGEEAVDEGGVTRELFKLLTAELFDPKYGMFNYSNETSSYWFNPGAVSSDPEEYFLVGATLALAVYNNTLLDVHFPSAVYEKLLGEQVTLLSLRSISPSVAGNLEKLLNYWNEDFEEVFSLSFEATYEVFGDPVSVELIPDGKNVAVTLENKFEYVASYVNWFVNTSVSKSFAEFSRGFHTVLSGPAITLFSSSELKTMVSGAPDLNFHELEKVTLYDGGYSPDTLVVKWFWNVVHSKMSLEQQRRLLLFVTGSDRAPIKGLGSVRFIIQRSGPDSDYLPTASTCFNVLLLPDYSSERKLEERLLKAITEGAEGFGLR
jgi:ubiquitin-protein ligase E3 A